MTSSGHFALIVLDHSIARAEKRNVELRSREATPTLSLLIADQTVANLHHRRRMMLDEMSQRFAGEGYSFEAGSRA